MGLRQSSPSDFPPPGTPVVHLLHLRHDIMNEASNRAAGQAIQILGIEGVTATTGGGIVWEGVPIVWEIKTDIAVYWRTREWILRIEGVVGFDSEEDARRMGWIP
ncbi:unnamed protein product [Zymoseptoria tritici ST99CH_1A5]|uniref:Uncharacterized protein n=3 Tax=Zymoseptoria tritici TaxID=1047171 RepID=F9XF46_ZYMTI|nr:uncharacterized protein MYCGRDRAFT_94774 [Zymoseptoria tritici IPO323]EGP85953.1 hypothetical protein MYCGRDRAFT_94774 [Zymoseptoria tritici IPO323]SMR55706.1 unnamed protein product [Zymoseptoria tritici ST99CH_1E4]SMY26516.1 unnamed protein product [Zymoseptoria tritici ST99CH_1A5]